jgi:predicted transcriptional regulator|tara:strand:+ start:755 stop:1030 length:276 start_codon:yes stop_codon:yes gene_type:complete
MAGRRTKMDIINDMLGSIQDKGGKIKPTHLMYKANLSHKLLNGYLDELVNKEMIGKIEGKAGNQYIIIKDKGHEFLAHFRKMREFQDTFGL